MISIFKTEALFDGVNIKYQYILVGFSFVNILIQYFVLFFSYNKQQISIFGFVILVLGLFFFIRDILVTKPQYNIILRIKSASKQQKLYILIIVCFFLVAIAPITNGDSLHYHIGVPVSLIKNGVFIWHKEWFHFGLSGISENTNLLSLALNAEQIPNLVQFFSIVAIIGLFRPKNLSNDSNKTQLSSILLLVFISTPILFFLASAAKPQLNGIALTSLVFFLIINNNINLRKLNFGSLLFILLLLFSACSTKLNFFLSSFFLFILVIIKNHEFIFTKKSIPFIFKLVGVALIAAITVFVPQIYNKITFLNISSIKDFFIPVPSNNPGSAAFLNYLRDYSDSKFPFPLSIFVPSSFGNIPMVLGFSGLLLIFIFLTNKFNNKLLLLYIAIFLITSIFTGQKTARFFFEPFIWLLLYIFCNLKNPTLSNLKLLKTSTYLTSAFTIAVLFFAIATLSIGNLSVTLREKTLTNNANGYILSKWVNSKLNPSTNVLLEHRSVSFFNQHIFSSDWSEFVDFNKGEDKFYSEYLKNKKVDYIVIVNENKAEASKLFKYCDKLLYGPFKFKTAKRNPFNSGEPLQAWIYTANFDKTQ